jgi:hypothetical protein
VLNEKIRTLSCLAERCTISYGEIILLIKYQISCSVGGTFSKHIVIFMEFLTASYTTVVSCVRFLFVFFVDQLEGKFQWKYKVRELVSNYTHKEEYADLYKN